MNKYLVKAKALLVSSYHPNPISFLFFCLVHSKTEQTEWWNGTFGRHCRERYLGGHCPWELDKRGCGYLHPEEGKGEAKGDVVSDGSGGGVGGDGGGMWCFGCG